MTGLYMQGASNYNKGFYMYLGAFSLALSTLHFMVLVSGISLLYLTCVQMFLTAFMYLIPFTYTAVMASSVGMLALSLTDGYLLHHKDMPYFVELLQYVSPSTWLFKFLLNKELSPEAVASSFTTTLCRNKQVSEHLSWDHF